MRRLSPSIFSRGLLFGLFLLLATSVLAQNPANLVQNNGFEIATNGAPAQWQYCANGATEHDVTHDLARNAAEGSSCLRLASHSTKHAHVWMKQVVAVEAGVPYQFTCQAKGFPNTDNIDYEVSTGFEFFDAAGNWLGYKGGANVAYRKGLYPSATVAPVTAWKKFSTQVIPPLGCAKLGIRLTLESDGAAEAYFDDLALTRPAQTVQQMLELTAPTIPVYVIAQHPVTAMGVTLTPDWRLDDAETMRSSERMRICLNGLWAFQPAASVTMPTSPKKDDWAFIKIPSFLGAARIYLIYGQDRTSWATTNVYTTAHAVWYLRDVDVPRFTTPQQVWLEISGLRGHAVRLYWNGQAVGTITNQQGGRVNLSNVAHPGEHGQLAIYALAAKPETKYAFLMEAGKMTRIYDPTYFDSYRGLLDVYLHIMPNHTLFQHVQVIPSVRTHTLGLKITPAQPVSPGTTYTVNVQTLAGKTVIKKTGLTALQDNGAFTLRFPWANAQYWNPDHPYLYQFTVQAVDANGHVLDETLPERFGFREVWVDGKELRLNGQPLRLRPRHANVLFVDGAAVRRQFSFLKDMGFNCVIRPSIVGSSHEQELWATQSLEEYYRIADEMGMMILPYTEYGLLSADQWREGDGNDSVGSLLMDSINRNQVQRLANHPSVIAYSGFGDEFWEGVNTPDIRPDLWGISSLSNTDTLAKALPDPSARKLTADRITALQTFIQRMKALDPTRPFLSHQDAGQADGWGTWDYLNWTPLQEWEDWVSDWAAHGTMPIGSTEHGLPYPNSFMNHGIPDGDYEPWITEYAARVLGPRVYENETATYLNAIQQAYDSNTKCYSTKTGSSHQFAFNMVDLCPENVQAVWQKQNAAVFRAWRTYGVPMGIEPFGRCPNYVQNDYLLQGNGDVIARPTDNLKTTGAKLDRWLYDTYWPSETMPILPSSPTGKQPQHLTPLGEALYRNNRPLLVYIAGKPGRFTAKDHVFWSGESIVKQVAVVWDGFSSRTLTATWHAVLNGKEIAKGNIPLRLTGGEIRLTPFRFTAPRIAGRAEGMISITVRDESGRTVADDAFPFQVYAPATPLTATIAHTVVLYDPQGQSMHMLTRLGIQPKLISNLHDVQPGQILVIGRGALQSLQTLQAHDLAQELPARTSILVLEQTDRDLQQLGLRAFPTRTREAYLPLTAPNTPLLRGIGGSDVCNWRVNPTLLPAGTAPLRDGYNYHVGYYGTIASVVIETPSRGNYLPWLQSEFDLGMTPLLEARIADKRIIFCQLSLNDGVGNDPVATRIATNLFTYLSTPLPATRPLAVVGSNNDLALAHDLGATVLQLTPADKLPSNGIALVGKVNAADAESIKAWVQRGGCAVVMPQELSRYAQLSTGITVQATKASLFPITSFTGKALYAGLGQNDFHYRQSLDVLQFSNKTDIMDMGDGKGQWVLVGFDPREIDCTVTPYLQLTYRHQYHVLSQLFTNLGATLDTPVRSVVKRMNTQQLDINITKLGQAKIKEYRPDMTEKWRGTDFDDAAWDSFAFSVKRTVYGHACLRITFPVPSTIPTGQLFADLGTIDDYDETYLNGTKIGAITPANSTPDTAWSTPRRYAIPAGLLKPGQQNVLAIYAWNRNAESKGWVTWIRGPMSIHTQEAGDAPYVGEYKHADDPYLQQYW